MNEPSPLPPAPAPPPRRSPFAPIALGVAITLLIGVAIKRSLHQDGTAGGITRSDDAGAGALRTNVFADFGPIADFTLTDKESRPFGLAQLRGKVWVLDFVFTTCSGPCIPMTQGMRTIFSGLQSEPDVEFVTVTVDPMTDTPDVLARFAKTSGADNPRWHWLTGDKKAIRELAEKSFYAAIGDKLPTGEVPHSTRYFVVDRDAHLRMVHDTQTDPDPTHGPARGVIDTVRMLLTQQPRPAPAGR
jgi:protein SCO1/2